MEECNDYLILKFLWVLKSHIHLVLAFFEANSQTALVVVNDQNIASKNTTKGLSKITPAIGKIIDLGEKHWNFVVLVFWKEKNRTGTMARILHLKIP